jgi:hypothetical protein
MAEIQAPKCNKCHFNHFGWEDCGAPSPVEPEAVEVPPVEVPPAPLPPETDPVVEEPPPMPKPKPATKESEGDRRARLVRNTRRWQKTHPEEYRAYMRKYMADKRAKERAAKGLPPKRKKRESK